MTTQTIAKPRADVATEATWEARLLEYRLARLLYDADVAFGPLDIACKAFDEDKARLGHEYGSVDRVRSTPDGAVRFDRAWTRIHNAEDLSRERHLEPMWEAARQLAHVPAPDYAALKIKLEVIELEELWNDCNMERDAFELIEADVARMRSEEA